MVLVTLSQSDGSTVELECGSIERCPLIEGHFLLGQIAALVTTSAGPMKLSAWSIPAKAVVGYMSGMRGCDLTDGQALSGTEKALYLQRKREAAMMAPPRADEHTNGVGVGVGGNSDTEMT